MFRKGHFYSNVKLNHFVLHCPYAASSILVVYNLSKVETCCLTRGASSIEVEEAVASLLLAKILILYNPTLTAAGLSFVGIGQGNQYTYTFRIMHVLHVHPRASALEFFRSRVPQWQTQNSIKVGQIG